EIPCQRAFADRDDVEPAVERQPKIGGFDRERQGRTADRSLQGRGRRCRRELGTRRALELQRRPANPEVEGKRDLGPVVDGPRIRVLIEVKRDAKVLPRQSWSEPSAAEGEADRDRAG